jgi:C-terminal processing protease CtpA/Prc
MKKRNWLWVTGLAVAALATFGGTLIWFHIQDLEAEIQALKTQATERASQPADRDELERLRLENQQIPGLKEDLKELYKLRASYDELVRLRKQYAELEARLTQSAPPRPAHPPLPPQNQGARLGVGIASVADQKAVNPALALPDGIMITQVLPDSPAAAAGLQPNDVVVAVDGVPVGTAADFKTRVSQRSPGQIVNLDIVRQGQTYHIMSATDPWPAQTN